MLIVCPSCASTYTLDTAQLGPAGRRLRCASCRTTWHVAPPEEPAAEGAEVPEPDLAELGLAGAVSGTGAEPITVAAASHREGEAPPARARSGQRSRRAHGRRPTRHAAATVALVLTALGLGVGAVAAREPIVRRLPQAARLYAAAGLAVNLRGLALAEITARQTLGDGGGLVVEGDVVNPTRRRLPVPALLVEVRDEHGETVYRWTAEPPRETLEPSESARFQARLAAPPTDGRRVLVRFADAAPAAPGPAPAAHEAKAEKAPPH